MRYAAFCEGRQSTCHTIFVPSSSPKNEQQKRRISTEPFAFATDHKKILKKFPLYETKSDEEYNYYGYDHTPYSIQVWEISYLSGLPKDSLVKLYLDYFRKKGLSLQKGSIKCGPVETPYPNTEKFGNKSGNCRILAIDSVKENESFVKFSYWNEQKSA